MSEQESTGGKSDALLSNEEYLEKYHEYLQMLVDEYVNGGRLDEVYSRIRGQIDSLVETDPTAFYDYEEYQETVQMLYDTIGLRAESIGGQGAQGRTGWTKNLILYGICLAVMLTALYAVKKSGRRI